MYINAYEKGKFELNTLKDIVNCELSREKRSNFDQLTQIHNKTWHI